MRYTLARVAALALCAAVPLSCEDPVQAGREQVIDGRFARWPDDGDEADAWRIDGAAELSVPGTVGHLVIRAVADDDAGTATLVPTTPYLPLELSLRHRGGAGRLEIDLDDGGAPLTAELPATDSWIQLRATLRPLRDGIRLRLLDRPGDDRPLRVDDVHLVEPSSGDVAHEPPIRILLVVHAESDIGSPERYWERRETLAGLAELAEAHGLPLTIQLSGAFAEWAIWEDDTGFYGDLLDRGHEIGTYVFPVYHEAHLDWEQGNIFEAGMADREWRDHAGWVDQLVGADVNRTATAYAPMAEMPRLMDEYGFDLDLASVAVTEEGGTSRESVAWGYLGHHPHHPFRPADEAVQGREYAGNPDAGYVSIGHAAQVGRGMAHGTPCGVEDYQRIFGLLLDRWTAHRAAPAGEGDDLVWVFGGLQNLKQTDGYGEDLAELLEHLDQVALGADIDGSRVASGATASDVLEEFEDWEGAHPDAPGFSFTLPP